jgi:hypothetical protein
LIDCSTLPPSIAGTLETVAAPRACRGPRLHPRCTSDDIRPRVGSSVYHLVVVARDPRSTHPMVTRRAAGVTKPIDHLQLFAAAVPPTLSPVLTSVRLVLMDPIGVALWRSTRLCCLTARGTWFLNLLGPMSSPTSGSSSTSSRQMTLLTGIRLVESFEDSLSATGWTTMRPLALSSSLPPSGLC